MRDLTYGEALEMAPHLLAIGETTVYLRDENERPWHIATAVQEGGSYRMNGCVSVWIVGEHKGLTFKWPIDFEPKSASGTGTSDFDRGYLREVMMKLPALARGDFVELLRTKILPAIEKNTAQIRAALHRQWDSEDAVRGLIAFAQKKTDA